MFTNSLIVPYKCYSKRYHNFFFFRYFLKLYIFMNFWIKSIIFMLQLFVHGYFSLYLKIFIRFILKYLFGHINSKDNLKLYSEFRKTPFTITLFFKTASKFLFSIKPPHLLYPTTKLKMFQW